MKHPRKIAILALAAMTAAFGFTSVSSASVYFSQQVTAIDIDGVPYPAVKIDPTTIPGMTDHTFSLGGDRLLIIKTNIENTLDKGLNQVAEVVRRCYGFVEDQSGLSLEKGVLLYLIEVERIPLSYSFEAAYPEGSDKWGEVRMALVEKGRPLFGPNADDQFVNLMYDTIPHELGHDLLEQLSPLKGDIDGRQSFHTRWFVEGVCEFLAMNFMKSENPRRLKHFMEMRDVDSVLSDAGIRSQIFTWPQRYGDDPMLESNLYGASMLLLMAWTETQTLNEILDRINCSERAICGADLVSMMESTTGRTKEQIMDIAMLIGSKFAQSNLAAPPSIIHDSGVVEAAKLVKNAAYFQ